MEGRAVARTEKKVAMEARTVVFVDESGFQLLPSVGRTYAPTGAPPILKADLWKKLSVISAVTSDKRLFATIKQGAFDGDSIVEFLNKIATNIQGNILLIWDGLPAHRGQAVRTFLVGGGAKRFLLERLPGYAPELNPDEGVWNYLKNVLLVNCCFKTTSDLEKGIEKGLEYIRQQPQLIAGFIDHAGLVI